MTAARSPARRAARIPVLLGFAFWLASAAARAVSPAAPGPEWITALGASEHGPGVYQFRKRLVIAAAPADARIHVSADNQFILFVNGEQVGAGPAYSDRAHWRYETCDLGPYLRPGANELAAWVWNFGDQAALAQISVMTGFLLWSDSAELAAADTDRSWSSRVDTSRSINPAGFTFKAYHAVGPGEILDAARLPPKSPAPQAGNAGQPAVPTQARLHLGAPAAAAADFAWHLVPDPLPAMEYRPVPAGSVVRTSIPAARDFPRKPATIPPFSRAAILLDRRTLTTAYPELTVSGGRGARITLRYAEALYGPDGRKGNRDDIGGKSMDPGMLHDEFLPDGSGKCVFSPLWWRTWRYLELDVETKSEPVTLDGLRAYFTAYPFEERAAFRSSDPELTRIWDVGWRTVRVNAHETYSDCPYWEQLQYAGDTRIEALVSYVMSGDDRLARQALQALAESRTPDGLTQSRYPSHAYQVIPPFSLLWIGMEHDFWLYRDDPGLLRRWLPVTRSVLAWFARRQRPDGLLGRLPEDSVFSWEFVDWSYPNAGVPPQDPDGGSVALTIQSGGARRDAADLARALGEPGRAKRDRENAARTAANVYRLAWDGGRGLLADTPARQSFSEDANILGVALDVIPAARQREVMERLLAPELTGTSVAAPSAGITPASYYFRFYLALALDHAGLAGAYLKLLGPWRGMLRLGLCTLAETPEPTRSDAHGWSAHPNYDLLTLVAGIQPAAAGFARVKIAPHLGGLRFLKASMPHPKGAISVDYVRTRGGLDATVVLPPGLGGVFVWKGVRRPLRPGRQQFRLK